MQSPPTLAVPELQVFYCPRQPSAPVTPFVNGNACIWSKQTRFSRQATQSRTRPTPSSAENLTSFEHVGDDGGFLGIGAVHELQPLQVVKVIVVGCHPRGVTLRPKLVDER